jgi:hypothetical protein
MKKLLDIFSTIQYCFPLFNSDIILLRLSKDLWKIEIKYLNKYNGSYNGTHGIWRQTKRQT